jgi:hypothetical protein
MLNVGIFYGLSFFRKSKEMVSILQQNGAMLQVINLGIIFIYNLQVTVEYLIW